MNELLDTPLNVSLTRWEMTCAIRDHLHETEFNRCTIGTDQCVMWEPARQIVDAIMAADVLKKAGAS